MDRFVEAVCAYEAKGDLEAFLKCFAEDCELRNAASGKKFQGLDGARHFWRAYRTSLKGPRTRFRTAIEAGDRAALEWKREGLDAHGEQTAYEGASVLEFEGDKVKRFFAYFDPVPLGRGIARELKEHQPLTNQSAVEGP